MRTDSSDEQAGPVEVKRRQRRPKIVAPGCTLTPDRTQVLHALAECGLLTKEQIRRFTLLPEKRVYYAVEDLQRAGYATATREFADLLNQADSLRGREIGLAWGKTAKVFIPTKAGVEEVVALNLYGRPDRHIHRLKEGTKAIVPHEVQTREVRVRMEEWRRLYPHHVVEGWRDGEDARLPYGTADARVHYWAVPEKVGRHCAIEIDRGSEKARQSWLDKRSNYEQTLQTAGWQRLTIVVVTPDQKRTDWIVRLLETSDAADRYYIATSDAFKPSLPADPIWTVPGRNGLHSLLPEKDMNP